VAANTNPPGHIEALDRSQAIVHNTGLEAQLQIIESDFPYFQFKGYFYSNSSCFKVGSSFEFSSIDFSSR
jgi:hypothetical protein